MSEGQGNNKEDQVLYPPQRPIHPDEFDTLPLPAAMPDMGDTIPSIKTVNTRDDSQEVVTHGSGPGKMSTYSFTLGQEPEAPKGIPPSQKAQKSKPLNAQGRPLSLPSSSGGGLVSEKLAEKDPGVPINPTHSSGTTRK